MCPKGSHNLIDILRRSDSYGDHEDVVRWCDVCGAIVVDVDYDGRTNAGQVMKMRFPNYVDN